jgi:hypothetical protein
MLVEIPNTDKTEARVKQFHRMLRTLKLTPYVHESALRARVSAELSTSSDIESHDSEPDHPDSTKAGPEIRRKGMTSI